MHLNLHNKEGQQHELAFNRLLSHTGDPQILWEQIREQEVIDCLQLHQRSLFICCSVRFSAPACGDCVCPGSCWLLLAAFTAAAVIAAAGASCRGAICLDAVKLEEQTARLTHAIFPALQFVSTALHPGILPHGG